MGSLSNMHRTFDFGPQLDRKDSNVPLLNITQEVTVLYTYTVNSTMYCLLSHFPSLMFAGNEDPLEEETQEERRYFR